MPVSLTYPGVYIEELPSGVRTITGVATSIAAFVGRAWRGPVDEPVTIFSYADYQRQFGGLWRDSTMSYAVQQFFQNGGSQAIIVRVATRSGASAATPATFKLGLGWWKMLSMQRVGLWIKGLRIQNGSQRWEDRWEVSPRCARWKCGPISFGAVLMNLGPPMRRWACVYFPNTGQTLLHVGVGVREMSITTRTGIEKFRRFTMSMRSALHF